VGVAQPKTMMSTGVNPEKGANPCKTPTENSDHKLVHASTPCQKNSARTKPNQTKPNKPPTSIDPPRTTPITILTTKPQITHHQDAYQPQRLVPIPLPRPLFLQEAQRNRSRISQNEKIKKKLQKKMKKKKKRKKIIKKILQKKKILF
jgi:hypothetical protein